MAVPPVFVAGAVLTAAQMNQIGLWRTKAQTSFSAASSIVADNVFTSDFETYCVIVRYTTTSTTGLAFRLRAGGVTAATNYNRALFTSTTTATSGTATSATSVTGLMNATNGAFESLSIFWVNGPQLASPTSGFGFNSQADGAFTLPAIQLAAFNHSTATAYDGFELTIGTGTTTGSYTVFGQRK